jgi:hypothetical protein
MQKCVLSLLDEFVAAATTDSSVPLEAVRAITHRVVHCLLEVACPLGPLSAARSHLPPSLVSRPPPGPYLRLPIET